MEIQRMRRIIVNEDIFTLRCAELMVINLMVFVGIGKLLAFFRARISTIIEAVALPVNSGEFCPFYMIRKCFFCFSPMCTDVFCLYRM